MEIALLLEDTGENSRTFYPTLLKRRFGDRYKFKPVLNRGKDRLIAEAPKKIPLLLEQGAEKVVIIVDLDSDDEKELGKKLDALCKSDKAKYVIVKKMLECLMLYDVSHFGSGVRLPPNPENVDCKGVVAKILGVDKDDIPYRRLAEAIDLVPLSKNCNSYNELVEKIEDC